MWVVSKKAHVYSDMSVEREKPRRTDSYVNSVKYLDSAKLELTRG